MNDPQTRRDASAPGRTSLGWIAPALGLAIVACLLSCDSNKAMPTVPTGTPPPPTTEPYRMLFIGNSLTYVNNLPGMVAALSAAAGDSLPIETRMVAFGGYALEDHLAQGDAARAIQDGPWDVVVLQQGPSSLPASRTNLIQYAREFAALIRNVGARPAMYGVWPEGARIGVLDACIESYQAAADSIGGISFPAARAWKAAWQMDPALPLYGPDQFHPSMLGTYEAAIVIYAKASGRSPLGLPTTFELDGGVVTIDSTQAHTAQTAAAQVIPTTSGERVKAITRPARSR